MAIQAPSVSAVDLRSVARSVVAGLDTLGQVSWTEQPPELAVEMLDILTAAGRKMEAVNADVINVIDVSQVWKNNGNRSPEEFIKVRTGSSGRTAKRAVHVARDFHGDFGATHRAVREGRISPDQADVIRRECSRSEKTLEVARNGGENDLIQMAEENTADMSALGARSWAVKNDPQGADRHWRTQLTKEHFTATPMPDGYSIRAFYTRENGNLIFKAAKAMLGPPPKDSTDTYFERLAKGIVTMAGQALDGGFFQPGARVRPHISVHVPHDTFRALIDSTGSAIPPQATSEADPRTGEFGVRADATLSAPGGPQDPSPDPDGAAEWAEAFQPGDDHVIATALDYSRLDGVEPARLECGTPISFQLLAYLACASTFMRIIYGPDSVILNAGREERLFTKTQTRAIYNRDRSCRFPGCGSPDHAGEIHHANWWLAHNGNTDIECGILLCKYHHGWVHAHDVTITRRGGKWELTTSDGGVIRTPRHAEIARIASGVDEPPSLNPAAPAPRQGGLRNRFSAQRSDSSPPLRSAAPRGASPPPKKSESLFDLNGGSGASG